MVAQASGPYWAVDDYLAFERNNGSKHEFHDGYVYAMAGGTQADSQIAVNIVSMLRAAVRGTGCRALNSDIKIRQSARDYVYADAVVTCDQRDFMPDQDWIEYPTLVVEVLSPSTEKYDRGAKFEAYKLIASLREYVLVDYRGRAVESWRRADHHEEWTKTEYGPSDNVLLENVGLTVTMDQVYEDAGV
jgi:Uma2 family endonuclease